MQPSDAHRVALLKFFHSGTDGRDEPHAFMAWNEGKGRLHRPVAARGVKIRVAHASRVHLDQDLAVARRGNGRFVDRQHLPKACTTAAFIVFAIAYLLLTK
jgi:hypothetical protein